MFDISFFKSETSNHTRMYSPQEIVLKAKLRPEKHKSNILLAITELLGVEKVKADAARGRVTVGGDLDPNIVLQKVRTVDGNASIETIRNPRPSHYNRPRTSCSASMDSGPCDYHD